MDRHQIWVEKSGRPQLLSATPDYALPRLARWTGLRMGRFSIADDTQERQVYGPQAVLTLFIGGQAESTLTRGLRRRQQAYRAGDLICFPGDMAMQRVRWRSQQARILSVEIDRTLLQRFEGADVRMAPRPLRAEACFQDADLAGLLRGMWREVQAGSPHGRLYAETLSVGLARRVFERFGGLPATPGEQRARLSAAQLRRVEDCLRTRLDQPIGLDDLAQAAGLSRYHFARVYKASTGQTPYQRLLTLRLERACTLLRDTPLATAEVALACGFASQSHLADTCRRVLGCTPGELRAGG